MKFTLEPLPAGIDCADLPGELSKVNASCVSRLCSAAAKRCRDMVRRRELPELRTQLGVRTLMFSAVYIRCELAALKSLSRLIDSRREFCRSAGVDISPEGAVWDLPVARPWFRSASWRDVEEFQSFVRSASWRQMRNLGLEIIDGLVESRQRQGDFRAPGDIWKSLTSVSARVSFNRPDMSPKNNWDPVSEAQMREIDAHLPPGTPEEGLLSLNAETRNHAGIARLLARTAWLTGARSCEIFRMRVLELNPEARLSGDQIKEAYRKPVAAIAADRFRDIEESRMRAAREAHEMDGNFHLPSGTPAILVIRTAKTANSSPKIDNAIRVQVLDGISWEDFHVLWLASRLSTPQYKHVRVKTLCEAANRYLKRASRELFPKRRKPVTLHFLRHAFADIARKTMRPAAVAALTGHTSLETMRGYGGKHTRFSRRNRSGRWMPQPDPARVEENAAAWRPTMKPGAEPNPMALPLPELLPEQ